MRKATKPSTVSRTALNETEPEAAKPVKTASMTQPATSLAIPAATVI